MTAATKFTGSLVITDIDCAEMLSIKMLVMMAAPQAMKVVVGSSYSTYGSVKP
jgi:hypothetical protein